LSAIFNRQTLNLAEENM